MYCPFCLFFVVDLCSVLCLLLFVVCFCLCLCFFLWDCSLFLCVVSASVIVFVSVFAFVSESFPIAF